MFVVHMPSHKKIRGTVPNCFIEIYVDCFSFCYETQNSMKNIC